LVQRRDKLFLLPDNDQTSNSYLSAGGILRVGVECFLLRVDCNQHPRCNLCKSARGDCLMNRPNIDSSDSRTVLRMVT